MADVEKKELIVKDASRSYVADYPDDEIADAIAHAKRLNAADGAKYTVVLETSYSIDRTTIFSTDPNDPDLDDPELED